jgi:xanthine dehydrogenase accessory factor
VADWLHSSWPHSSWPHSSWIDEARAALMHGPAALVTILATEGSAPRGAGTRMVVTAQTLAGTIGGGALEYRVVEQARALLTHPPGSWRIQDYPLGPLLGQCCGGRVRLLVENLDTDEWFDLVGQGMLTSHLALDRIERSLESAPVPPVTARGERPRAFVEPIDTARHPLVMFGAGHVGRAIARTSVGLPFQLAWYDSRPEAAEMPGVMLAEIHEMIACAGDVPAGAAVLVLTHDHDLDYRLTAAALRGKAGFVGLIGSATKRARFVSRLAADGVDVARLTCPIGLPGIAGKEPQVIAVSVLAQLLMMRGEA